MGDKSRKRGGRKSRDFREEFVSLNSTNNSISKNPQVEKEYGQGAFGEGTYGGEQPNKDNRVAEGVEYETGKKSDIPLSEKRGID